MKMPRQLSGDYLDAICGIVGVFFWKPFHTVSRKQQVIRNSFICFLPWWLSTKFIMLCILLKHLSEKREVGGKWNTNQTMYRYTQLVKQHICFESVNSFIFRTGLPKKHLGCIWKADETLAHLSLAVGWDFFTSYLFNFFLWPHLLSPSFREWTDTSIADVYFVPCLNLFPIITLITASISQIVKLHRERMAL